MASAYKNLETGTDAQMAESVKDERIAELERYCVTLRQRVDDLEEWLQCVAGDVLTLMGVSEIDAACQVGRETRRSGNIDLLGRNGASGSDAGANRVVVCRMRQAISSGH